MSQARRKRYRTYLEPNSSSKYPRQTFHSHKQNADGLPGLPREQQINLAVPTNVSTLNFLNSKLTVMKITVSDLVSHTFNVILYCRMEMVTKTILIKFLQANSHPAWNR
jgi:hypothetical protein